MPPRFGLLPVDWLLFAAILSPPLVVRVCGQRCPPYYTVPPSWCTKNPTEEERRAYHDQPLPYNCSDAAWAAEDRENYNTSVTLTEQDFVQCSENTYEECCPVFKTLAANITVTAGDWVRDSLRLCLVLEAPLSMKVNIQGHQSTSNRLILEIYTTSNGLKYYPYYLYLYLRHYYQTSFSRLSGAPIRPEEGKRYFYHAETIQPLANLHTYCYEDNEGYIQTSEWDGKDNMYHLTNSCVTIIVPDNHVIMISFIDLEYYDHSLILRPNAGCEVDGEQIYRLSDFSPRVFEDAQNVSVHFYSQTTKIHWMSGFRLLYSFHPRSAQPERLTNGTWNCSVSFFSEFQDHFLCTVQAACSEDEKNMFRCIEHDLCGTVMYTVQRDDFCYTLFKSSESWDDAAMKCELRGGHLAIPSSETKLSVVKNMTQRYRETHIGLKATSSTAPEIYRNTWQWSNNTLAITFDIIDSKDLNYRLSFQTPVCVRVQLSNNHKIRVDIVMCTDKDTTAFICESYQGPITESDKHTTGLLPKLPAKTPDGKMMQCTRNQLAYEFLACDADTNCFVEVDGSTSVCAQTRFTLAMPLFTRNNDEKRIPYSLVCDHRSDCCDSSDEDFCQFPACGEKNAFVCENKQCIPKEKQCDGRSDCLDESDESLCQVSDEQDDAEKDEAKVSRSIIPPPAVVNFTNRSTITVTALNSSSCPETHFRCPGNGYCMPVYVLCNDVFDCPGMEDEQGCDAFTCPGYYRCRASRTCLHLDHLCDGVFQCPQRDDELLCDLTCPDGCDCFGYAFICNSPILAEQHPDLRYLQAPHTEMKLSDVSSNKLLVSLDLRYCNIDNISRVDFPNLRSLDLGYNKIEVVTAADITQFGSLRVLSLAHNPLVSVSDFIDGLHIFDMLIGLNLAGLSMPELSETFPVNFPKLQVLNLSSTGLDRVSESGFRSFSRLRQLDLHGCSMQTFFPGVFDGLSTLDFVRTDNYKLCCPSNLPYGFDANKCEAPTDEISSCDALLRSDVFRVFLTLYAFLSLVGNLASFLFRAVLEKTNLKMGFEIFVTHLCVADFLMGVYLAIIGVADRVYYGDYRWNDVTWRHSTACKVAGFLSLLSSEVSAFLICIITLERFLVIRFPLKNLHFRRGSAHAACLGLWILGLLLATVPLLPSTAHWELYSQSGICVPLPISRKEFPGDDYAFAVVIGLNFVLFVMTAVGQLLIYVSVRANAMPAQDSSKKSKDMTIARRLLAVVMTDFLCWFPIGVLGILAKIGVPIPGDANVVMAIFVLPFNSALNPFLYTFNMVMERRQKARQQRLAKEEKTELQSANVHSPRVTTRSGEFTTITNDDVWKLFEGRLEDGALSPDNEDAWKLFNGWLENGILSADRVRRRMVDNEDAWKLFNGWLENGVLSADRVRRRMVDNTCT